MISVVTTFCADEGKLIMVRLLIFVVVGVAWLVLENSQYVINSGERLISQCGCGAFREIQELSTSEGSSRNELGSSRDY
jgi:hypothetical protein